VVTTGLCRLLARRGVSVAPFKSQNMSNNSMVVIDADTGVPGEIGRAQWIQAVAAQARPEVAMNPVLLKPGGDKMSHVVLNGQPFGLSEASEFAGARTVLAEAAFAAFESLRGRFDCIIAEGAGSPAEVNLREHDYINMGLARRFNIPTIVVGDIDRGGVYAALYGTLALLDTEDQALIRGWLINKFRGDETLLTPANDYLEARTCRPVLGVLPWHPSVWLDSEDGMDVEGRRAYEGDPVRVAVVRLPRISNFTDVDALGLEPDVDVRFVSSPRELSGADLVIVPGTRGTIADLEWLHSRGLDVAVAEHAKRGGALLGICGGAQMLGKTIDDTAGIEGVGTRVDGLGIVDLATVFTSDKKLALHDPGYEIHHGRISVGAGDPWPGGVRDGRVIATMIHGSLEDDAVRAQVLEIARPGRPASSVQFAAARERRLDLLADLIEQHSDVERLLSLIG
jgi:adenosylcobyric acid synthase